MLATFVIGLREGLECSLVIGLISAVVIGRGRRDLIAAIWAGVAIAVAVSFAVAGALQLARVGLPARSHDGLEAVLALVAVGIVTWMVIGVRRQTAGAGDEVTTAAARALARGGALALAAMAMTAVLREGVETAVFLLAAVQTTGPSALAGAGLGIFAAALASYAFYRGGMRAQPRGFLRVTAVVLVIVAGGLLASALHSAGEAGWLQVGQQRALDLSWLARPGSWAASLMGGVLGLDPHPTRVEVVAWLLYVLPAQVYVAWPRRGSDARVASSGQTGHDEGAPPAGSAGSVEAAVQETSLQSQPRQL
jgi:high-affinity iron transporter